MKRRARWLSWIFCRRTTHEPRRLIYHSVGSSQGNCHLRQICEKSKKRKSCKVVYFKMGAPMTWPPHLSHWFLLIEAFGSPVVVNQRHRPLNNRKTRCSYSTDTVRSTVPLFSSSKMEMDLIETELPDPEASFFFLFFCCFGFLPFTICKSILLSCIHWGNRCKLKIRLAI